MSASHDSFLSLLWSDYVAHYSNRPAEPSMRAALLWLPRLFVNPSLQLPFLVRVAQCGPTFLRSPVRWLQVILFSSEIYVFGGEDGLVIGPGLTIPHPINIIIGPGARLGSRVQIYNNCSIGTDRSTEPGMPPSRTPTIGDDVVIFPYGTVQGPYTIGDGAAVGMHVILRDDVEAGMIQTINAVRPFTHPAAAARIAAGG